MGSRQAFGNFSCLPWALYLTNVTEGLLCTRDRARCWDWSLESRGPKACLLEASILCSRQVTDERAGAYASVFCVPGRDRREKQGVGQEGECANLDEMARKGLSEVTSQLGSE